MFVALPAVAQTYSRQAAIYRQINALNAEMQSANYMLQTGIDAASRKVLNEQVFNLSKRIDALFKDAERARSDAAADRRADFEQDRVNAIRSQKPELYKAIQDVWRNVDEGSQRLSEGSDPTRQVEALAQRLVQERRASTERTLRQESEVLQAAKEARRSANALEFQTAAGYLVAQAQPLVNLQEIVGAELTSKGNSAVAKFLGASSADESGRLEALSAALKKLTADTARVLSPLPQYQESVRPYDGLPNYETHHVAADPAADVAFRSKIGIAAYGTIFANPVLIVPYFRFDVNRFGLMPEVVAQLIKQDRAIKRVSESHFSNDLIQRVVALQTARQAVESGIAAEVDLLNVARVKLALLKKAPLQATLDAVRLLSSLKDPKSSASARLSNVIKQNPGRYKIEFAANGARIVRCEALFSK